MRAPEDFDQERSDAVDEAVTRIFGKRWKREKLPDEPQGVVYIDCSERQPVRVIGSHGHARGKAGAA